MLFFWRTIDRFNLRKVSDSPVMPLARSSNPVKDIPDTTILPFLDILESCHSGRIVNAPNKFMFLGESISDEHDLDPSNYHEVIFDKYYYISWDDMSLSYQEIWYMCGDEIFI